MGTLACPFHDVHPMRGLAMACRIPGMQRLSDLISESSGPEVAAVIGTVVTINSTLSFRPVFCHLLRQEAHITCHDMMVSKKHL